MKTPHRPPLVLIASAASLLLPVALLAQAVTTAMVDEQPVQLSAFEVSSEGDRGYLSTQSASASRIGQELRDITQTISVINKEFINDLAPLDLNDIMRYAADVDVLEGQDEVYNIRGNTVAVALQNGFRTPSKFPSDSADIERVEVLAGPASVLYGNVFGIGGVVNRVTKRPHFNERNSLKLSYIDDLNSVRAVFDTTRALGNSRKVAYSLTAMAQDGEFSEWDHSYLNRYMILPKVLFKLGEKTTLVVEMDFTRQEASAGQNLGKRRDYIVYRRSDGTYVGPGGAAIGGIPNVPVIINVPDNANPEAHLVEGNLRFYGSNFYLTSQLTDQWSFRFAGLGAHFNYKWSIPVTTGAINPTNQRTINRARLRERDRTVENYFLQADLAGKYRFGGTKVDIVFGAEYGIDRGGSNFRIAAATTPLPAFDFFNPDYTVRRPEMIQQQWDDQRTYAWAGFGMVGVSMLKNRLLFNAGARVIDFRGVLRTNRTNGPRETLGETGVIPKAGILGRITEDIGVYYGYSEAYSPTTTFNQITGDPNPPTAGQQHEIGVKVSLFNGRVSATAAVFALEQVNLLEEHPEFPDLDVPTRSQTSEGYSFGLVYSPTDYWQIIGGYSQVEKEVTSSLVQNALGVSITGNPDHIWKLWTRYRFQIPALEGLAIGAGTNFYGNRDVRLAASNSVSVVVPEYQLYDAMLSYSRKNISFQLNARNLADKLYYPSGNQNNFMVGQPRRIIFTTTYRF